jgi:signal transduction histidine kinase
MVHRQFAAVLAERARVSREIHDTLLQGVVGIALQLDHLEQTQTGDSKENARRFERLRLHLEAYVRDARRSILDLRSPVLEQQTFEGALNEIGARLTADTNIDFSVEVKGKPRGCSPRMENELLRIAHEAIANAVRHSHASAIHVQLRFEEQSVALRVTDDGCGFNVERVAADSHARFGLVSMKERAKTLGGELRVDTAVHRGTDVEAVFPIRAAG